MVTGSGSYIVTDFTPANTTFLAGWKQSKFIFPFIKVI